MWLVNVDGSAFQALLWFFKTVSLYSAGCPWTWISVCLYLLFAGNKGVNHQDQMSLFLDELFYRWSLLIVYSQIVSTLSFLSLGSFWTWTSLPFLISQILSTKCQLSLNQSSPHSLWFPAVFFPRVHSLTWASKVAFSPVLPSIYGLSLVEIQTAYRRQNCSKIKFNSSFLFLRLLTH